MINMKNYLFICTGNFYRSRFAESYFNFLCIKYNLSYRAKSAGLKPYLADEKAAEEGEISILAKNKLDALGISKDYYDKNREELTEEMLQNSDIIIAMDEDEHFSMIKNSFPNYLKKVIFYGAKDIEYCDHHIALNYIKKMIEEEVFNLFINK
jgi:protein-tyrosine phosphatase